MKKRYLIIGASAAGISAAVKIRQLDNNADIICFTDEKEMPYNKCFLADYLSGAKTVQETALRSEAFFKDQNIQVVLNTFIKRIDLENRYIVCDKDQKYFYTKLLIATGGSVHLPDIKGINFPHVFPFYTLNDTQALLDYVCQHHVKKVVIIGAGLSGLECADSLKKYVASIVVLEREKHLLPHHVTQEGADFIQKKMEEIGITFTPQVIVTEINFDSVVLDNGKEIAADMVVCAIGARPNSTLARNAGLAVNRGALATDDFLTTSHEDIFAAGDCAQVKDKITGNMVKSCTWPDALVQGSIAGTNMVERTRSYPGVVLVASSSFFGVKFFSAGDIKSITSYNSSLCQNSEGYRLILHHKNIIKGFVLIGQTHGIADLKRSLLTATESAIFE